MKETTINNCDIIRDLLPGYLEHLLSEAGETAVEEHLLRCGECRQVHDEMKKETFKKNPSPEDSRALDGFKKIRRHTWRLQILAAGALFLVLSGILSGFLMLFIIGKPAGTYWIDDFTCVYDEASDSLTVRGHAQNLNISKVIWKTDASDETFINILVYETEALPFTSETHDFSIVIPEIKGRNVCLACPDYDRRQIYSWGDNHYKQIEQMKEAIYQQVESLDQDTDILYYYPRIYSLDGMRWLTFHIDHVIGENATYWNWGDKIVTDGDLEPADYEVWISLDTPYEIRINDYQTGTFEEDDSV